MLRQFLLLIVLSLTFQAPLAIAQTKCKGYKPPIGPGRGGGREWARQAGLPIINVKPGPKYTKAALRHQVNGTVLLRAVMHSSGQVREVCVITGLPYGLTKRAVEAAYKIEFEPAVKDGRPVSKTIQLEYNFNTY